MNVSLDIRKGIYRDYLSYLFEKDEQGRYLVSRTNYFGKILCSRVQYGALPDRSPKSEATVEFILPKSRPLTGAKHHFLYYTIEDQQKLNDELEVIFNIDFDRYYLQGMKMKYQQKQIIQSFIVSRNLVNMIGDNETLKKRQYRDELETLKKMTDTLIKQAEYRNSRIVETLNLSICL